MSSPVLHLLAACDVAVTKKVSDESDFWDMHIVAFYSLYSHRLFLYVWLNLLSYRLRGHGHSEHKDSVRDRHG